MRSSLRQLKARCAYGWIADAILLVSLLMVIRFGFTDRPRQPDSQETAIKAAAEWINKSGLAQRPIITVDDLLFYYVPIHLKNPTGLWTKPPVLKEQPPGTLVVWDNRYSELWGLHRSKFASRPMRWQLIREFGNGLVAIYEKKAAQRNSA